MLNTTINESFLWWLEVPFENIIKNSKFINIEEIMFKNLKSIILNCLIKKNLHLTFETMNITNDEYLFNMASQFK